MNYSELPKFPPVPPSRATAKTPYSPRFTERHRRFLRDGLLAIGLVGIMLWMRYLSGMTQSVSEAKVPTVSQAVPEPPANPVEFNTASNRRRNALFKDRSRVEMLLGPPTRRSVPHQEMKEWDEQIEAANRHHGGLPQYRRWDKWIDPEDTSRWFAVIYDVDLDEVVYVVTSEMRP